MAQLRDAPPVPSHAAAPPRPLNACVVFAGYLALAIVLFGRGLFGAFTTKQIGISADPELMDWMLVWWPHALLTHRNPFLTDAFWAPVGFNLAWTTSIPLIALAAAPITLTLGPLAALNSVCLLSVALAAWAAFALCRYLCGDGRAASVGGFVFGFSPYMLGPLCFGRLHLLAVWPVPLILLISLRRWRGELDALRYGALIAALVAAELYCSVEIAATMTMFGGLALLLAWAFDVAGGRPAMIRVAVPAAAGYAIAAAVASPLLYYYFFGPRPVISTMWPDRMVSGDLLNLLIPTVTNELGRIPALARLSSRFNIGLPGEATVWIAPPLIVVVALFARRHWREPAGRLMVDLLVIIMILALGRRLIFAGHPTRLGLPAKLLDFTPLANAGAARFSMYAFILIAIMVARWLAESELSARAMGAIAAAIILFMTPNLSAALWARPVNQPPFFRDGLYRARFEHGETVLILPVWLNNEAMLWQAQSGMYFKLAQGVAPWPRGFDAWPILDALAEEAWTPEAPAQLAAYLADNRVRYLVIDNRVTPVWSGLAADLCAERTQAGGVTLWRPAPGWMGAAPVPTMLAMRRRFDLLRFYRMVAAVDRYLAHGGDPRRLKSADAVALGIIPAAEVIGPAGNPQARDRYRVLIEGDRSGAIRIAETAWSEDAPALIATLGPHARRARFVSWAGRRAAPAMGSLTMTFDRAGLGRAAAAARHALAAIAPANPGCAAAAGK